MNYYFFYTILSALGWSLCIILEKYYLLNFFEPTELLLLRNSLFVLVFIYFILTKKSYVEKIKKMKPTIGLGILGSFVFSSIALLTYWYLLHNTQSSYTVASVQPMIIMMVVLMSHFFYGEKISFINKIGILFTIIGVFLLNISR
jgi:uncharacterized membrane protein